MFRKKKVQKENNLTYFIGGTAVGMAAGLLFGKVLSNISNNSALNSESEVIISKYSPNGNIKNVSVKQNICNSVTYSESASKYKEIYNSTETAVFQNKFDKDWKCNINNLDMHNNYDKSVQQSFNGDKHYTLHNTNSENKTKYDLSSIIWSGSPKIKNNYNVKGLCKSESTKELESNASMKNYLIKDKIFVGGKDNSGNNNNNNKGEMQKTVTENKIELTDMFDLLSINFSGNLSSCTNVQNITDINAGSNCIHNFTNMATYNDSMHFSGEETIDELNSTSIDEFCEIDLISSTKQDNF